MRFYGCHVSVAGGLHNGLKNGEELGVNTIQVHPSPPQRWNAKPYKPDAEAKYLELKPESSVEKVFFHTIYLINLATPIDKNYTLSKKSLLYDLEYCDRVKGDGVIVHVGSMKDQDEDEGYRRATEAINWIMGEYEGESPLLLEVSAGGGRIIGARMEELARIYEGLNDQDRVGFALDTQHMWASGYDLKGDLEGVIKQIKKHFGLKRVKAIHLNDSMTELDSRRDRHANLGEGEIGTKALKAFVNHTALRRIPIMLETPGLKEVETAKKEVKRLNQWIEE